MKTESATRFEFTGRDRQGLNIRFSTYCVEKLPLSEFQAFAREHDLIKTIA